MNALEAFQGSYNEQLVRTAREKRWPITGTFELLPNCNMRCRMCYIQHAPQAGEKLQPVSFWTKLIGDAVEGGMLFPLITGGEPFLYPEFRKLYEEVVRLPAYFVINTNATLLDEKTMDWLAAVPPRRLNISLYGASNDTYARLCKNPQGYTQVIRAFEGLRARNIDFRVHCTIVPENVGDYKGIIDICDHFGAPLAMTFYMFPPFRKGESIQSAAERFSPEELSRLCMQYKKDQANGDMESYARMIELSCKMIENPQYTSIYNQNGVACLSGICSFWVDYRGRMSGCGVHNQQTVDLHQVPFADAWKRVVADTEKIRISEKCKTCKYRSICYNCPAAAFCETGSMSETPEYLCAFSEAYAKLLFEERGRLFA